MVVKIKVAGPEYVNFVSLLLCIMTLLKDPFFHEAMPSTIAIHKALYKFISNFILAHNLFMKHSMMALQSGLSITLLTCSG